MYEWIVWSIKTRVLGLVHTCSRSKFEFFVFRFIFNYLISRDKKGFHKNVHHRLFFSKALIYNRIYRNLVDSLSRKPRERSGEERLGFVESSHRGEDVLSFSFAFPLRKPVTLAKAWFERFFFLQHNLCLKLTVLLNRTSDDVTRTGFKFNCGPTEMHGASYVPYT